MDVGTQIAFSERRSCKDTPRAVRERLLPNKTQQPTAANLFGVTEGLRGFTGKKRQVSDSGKHVTPQNQFARSVRTSLPPPTHILFFDNPPLCYNLLNNHLFAFRQRLLKFQYQAIFIIEEYVKQ